MPVLDEQRAATGADRQVGAARDRSVGAEERRLLGGAADVERRRGARPGRGRDGQPPGAGGRLEALERPARDDLGGGAADREDLDGEAVVGRPRVQQDEPRGTRHHGLGERPAGGRVDALDGVAVGERGDGAGVEGEADLLGARREVGRDRDVLLQRAAPAPPADRLAGGRGKGDQVEAGVERRGDPVGAPEQRRRLARGQRYGGGGEFADRHAGAGRAGRGDPRAFEHADAGLGADAEGADEDRAARTGVEVAGRRHPGRDGQHEPLAARRDGQAGPAHDGGLPSGRLGKDEEDRSRDHRGAWRGRGRHARPGRGAHLDGAVEAEHAGPVEARRRPPRRPARYRPPGAPSRRGRARPRWRAARRAPSPAGGSRRRGGRRTRRAGAAARCRAAAARGAARGRSPRPGSASSRRRRPRSRSPRSPRPPRRPPRRRRRPGGRAGRPGSPPPPRCGSSPAASGWPPRAAPAAP